MEGNESNGKRYLRVPRVPKKQLHSILILAIAFIALQGLSGYLMKPVRVSFQEATSTATSLRDFGSIVYPPKLYVGGDQDEIEIAIKNPFPEPQFATVCLDIRDRRITLGPESSNIISFELKPLETKEFSRRVLTSRAINDAPFDSNLSITAILSLIPILSSGKVEPSNPCTPQYAIIARAHLDIQPDVQIVDIWPIRQLLRQILGLNLPYFIVMALTVLENAIFGGWQKALRRKTQSMRMRIYMRAERWQVLLSYFVLLFSSEKHNQII